jgi:hypothetical protein
MADKRRIDTMTPQEKAKELVKKYVEFKIDGQHRIFGIELSKQCALIAVNEIIEAIDWHEFETPNKQINYWLDVRKEISNL